MSKRNLKDPNIADIFRRLKRLETNTMLASASVGRGRLRFYDGSVLLIENGALNVTGTATISGVLDVSGITNLKGQVSVTGPMEISGTTNITGNTNIMGELNESNKRLADQRKCLLDPQAPVRHDRRRQALPPAAGDLGRGGVVLVDAR